MSALVALLTYLSLPESLPAAQRWVLDKSFGERVSAHTTDSITAVDIHYYQDNSIELFVAQHGKPGVLVFSPVGDLQRSFGREVLDTPHGNTRRLHLSHNDFVSPSLLCRPAHAHAR